MGADAVTSHILTPKAEICSYKTWRLRSIFQSEFIIIGCSFCFIWISMLYKYFTLSAQPSSLDVGIWFWRLKSIPALKGLKKFKMMENKIVGKISESHVMLNLFCLLAYKCTNSGWKSYSFMHVFALRDVYCSSGNLYRSIQLASYFLLEMQLTLYYTVFPRDIKLTISGYYLRGYGYIWREGKPNLIVLQSEKKILKNTFWKRIPISQRTFFNFRSGHDAMYFINYWQQKHMLFQMRHYITMDGVFREKSQIIVR